MSAQAKTNEPSSLNVFCSLQNDAFRLYVRPGNTPPFLQHILDEHGEAYPLLLDLDDLDRYLARKGASVEKQWSRKGGVELTARGHSAAELAKWLANAFSSNVRT